MRYTSIALSSFPAKNRPGQACLPVSNGQHTLHAICLRTLAVAKSEVIRVNGRELRTRRLPVLSMLKAGGVDVPWVRVVCAIRVVWKRRHDNQSTGGNMRAIAERVWLQRLAPRGYY
jgi:hypothetical protein